MNESQIQSLRVGDYLMPDEGKVSSSIRIIEILPKGIKVKRVNLAYEGEEFFMAPKMLSESKWVTIPDNSQLAFL